MSKRKAAAEADSRPPGLSLHATWPNWKKALVSGLLAFHVLAVFVAPFAFACNAGGSSSPFADAIAGALRPYIVALYLDHGYFFFAPNPGPSRLVDYEITFADGRPSVKGRFPNVATERPRLLYHRHFMLSEALSNRFVPPTPPPEPSPPPLTASGAERIGYQLAKTEHERAVTTWRGQRNQYEAMRRSIEEHLKAAHGGDKVTLTRIEHRLALPDEVQAANRELNAAASYIELPETPREVSR
jgi:hypothetical protein